MTDGTERSPDPAGSVRVHVNHVPEDHLSASRVEEVVRQVVREEGVGVREISVTFLSDDEIRTLHRRYLGQDRPTDVLAFTLDADESPPQGEPGTEGSERPAGEVIGDVYVGLDEALRSARERAIPGAEELLRLVIHGVLHVAGYDHPEGPDREGSPMYRRQEEILGMVIGRRPPSDPSPDPGGS